MNFDLDLFRRLNVEYETKPLVPKPPLYAATDLATRGAKRAATLQKRFDVAGKRVLEIGCGRGEVCRALAAQHGCEVVGVDISTYPEWVIPAPNVRLLDADLTGVEMDSLDLGTFDFVCSFSVWEHIRHPYTMLKRVREVLRPNGSAFISANLFRGPKASHRYREVFFPWPHLLFTDEVFEQFYSEEKGRPSRPAWVNRLSVADYRNYFDLLDFKLVDLSFTITSIDEPFYERFRDILERYPRYDLERDFMHAYLKRGVLANETSTQRSGQQTGRPVHSLEVVALSSVALSPTIVKTKRRYPGEEARARGIYSEWDWSRISYVFDQLTAGGHVLDVGVGAGQLINTLGDIGHFERVVGIDVTTHSKFFRANDGFEIHKMSVADMRFPDNEFDIVICMEVLEHLDDDTFVKALSELRRVCRGQLMVTVPFEEPEPLPSFHKQRFDRARIEQCWPGARVRLLERPSVRWALIEENFG